MMLSDELYNKGFFGFSGRIKRWDFAKKNFLLVAVFMTISTVDSLWDHHENILVLAAMFAIYMCLLVSAFGLAVRRLHDFDATGWFSLWSFVPLANIALAVFLFSQESKPLHEPNKYGLPKEPHK